MNFGCNITKLLVVAGMWAIATAASSQTGTSEDIDIEALRGEFKKAVTDEAAAEKEFSPGFTIEERELEERRARLLAQESKLLEEIQSGDASAADPSPKVETVTAAAEEKGLVPFSEPTVTTRAAVESISPPPAQAAERRQPVISSAALLEKDLANLKKLNAQLDAQLKGARMKSQDLSRELRETKDRLMITETEVERLSRILRDKNSSTLARFGASPLEREKRQATAVEPPKVNVANAAAKVAAEDEPLIATVMSDKVNLRTGPGKDNSPFMTVSKGTRLVVEKRVGEWYRVISPAGTRAWVASEVIAFGETAQSSPSRTVRIRGYDASLDNKDPVKLIGAQVR